MLSRNTAAVFCINKQIVPICSPVLYTACINNISPQHYCYDLAWLLEAFTGVAVNKQDRLEDEGMKMGDEVAE
jgi:hypothetical protein